MVPSYSRGLAKQWDYRAIDPAKDRLTPYSWVTSWERGLSNQQPCAMALEPLGTIVLARNLVNHSTEDGSALILHLAVACGSLRPRSYVN